MIEAKNFTLPGLEEDGGLINAMVRYRPESPATEVSATPFERPRVQLSLVLLHGISSHKETWLPTIEHLFQLQQAAPTNVFTIVEAWSLDGPNHGHAGIMNQHKLAGRIPGEQAARAILVFLNSGLVAAGSTVVAIGHSAGACIMVQSTDDYPVNQLPFASLIMVDPPMLTPETLSIALREGWPLIRAIDIARKRKDVWPSRAAAREWLAKRWPWSRWDPRVLDLYVEHALCDLPTPSHPDLKAGVTLSTTREQEAWGYSGHDDAHASLERLKDLCPAIPVHCIFGGQIDMVPLEGQAAIVDEAAGRRMRSIVRVAQSGHLIVQENPRDLALALWGILHEDYGQPSARAADAARL
ncbi:alpha/beta-hydrolase [Trametes coccinea BRFM310]|uniref:Alpha/beta-hydrolase n=1 Tax=Trametes coccinea (strain BRFM310) TaxID=1353009 RepID=A0A1Y2IL58_TRAC3|nr:alpha/beta-hydrolase [Trametes coccinea BRFM310]